MELSHDYQHIADYDPPDTQWSDISVAGTIIQQQIATNKSDRRWRDFYARGPWKQGAPPKCKK